MLDLSRDIGNQVLLQRNVSITKEQFASAALQHLQATLDAHRRTTQETLKGIATLGEQIKYLKIHFDQKTEESAELLLLPWVTTLVWACDPFILQPSTDATPISDASRPCTTSCGSFVGWWVVRESRASSCLLPLRTSARRSTPRFINSPASLSKSP